MSISHSTFKKIGLHHSWTRLRPYKKGDLTTEDGKVYIALRDHIPTPGDTTTGSPSQPTQDVWEATGGASGHDAWVVTRPEYKIGDLCTEQGNAYIAVRNHIPTSGNTSAGSPTQPIQSAWIPVKGNINDAWTLNRADYKIGDLVTELGNVYIAIRDHSPASGDTVNGSPVQPNQTGWKIVGTEEIGGVEYSATTKYSKGDQVTDTATLPATAYISIADNNTGNPLTSGIHWQEQGSIFYNAGMFTPVAGTEYPVTTGEVKGATWFVDGLGTDGNGDPVKYTMTTGNLSGRDVTDGDSFGWVDGAIGSEKWFYSPIPTLSAERGGILWRSSTNYLLGDLVTDNLNGELYSAIIANSGQQPSADNGTNWQRSVIFERGIEPYTAGKNYKANTLVFHLLGIYKVDADITNAPATPVWSNLSVIAGVSKHDKDGDVQIEENISTGNSYILPKGNNTGYGILRFGTLHRQMTDLHGWQNGIGTQEGMVYIRSENQFSVYSGGQHHGDANNPGSGGRVILNVSRDRNVTSINNVTQTGKLTQKLITNTAISQTMIQCESSNGQDTAAIKNFISGFFPSAEGRVEIYASNGNYGYNWHMRTRLASSGDVEIRGNIYQNRPLSQADENFFESSQVLAESGLDLLKNFIPRTGVPKQAQALANPEVVERLTLTVQDLEASSLSASMLDGMVSVEDLSGDDGMQSTDLLPATRKCLDYNQVTVLLVAAVKELEAANAVKDARMDAMQAQIDALIAGA